MAWDIRYHVQYLLQFSSPRVIQRIFKCILALNWWFNILSCSCILMLIFFLNFKWLGFKWCMVFFNLECFFFSFEIKNGDLHTLHTCKYNYWVNMEKLQCLFEKNLTFYYKTIHYFSLVNYICATENQIVVK